MKTRIISMILGLTLVSLFANAQNVIYRMHVKLQDGSTYTVKADDVKEVYFTASQPYDPSNPVTADVTSIHAPKDGGTYIVHISSSIPLTIEGDVPGLVSFSDRFLNKSTVSLTKSYSEGILTIVVNPTTRYIVDNTIVRLYDYEGTEAFSITVSQDSDPNATLLSEYGNGYILEMAETLVNSHAKYRMADVNYTGIWPDNSFKAPLDPYDYRLQDLWDVYWQLNYRNMLLLQHCDEIGMEVIRPMCSVINALCYYELVTLFGGVPYFTDIDDAMNYLPRTSPNVILNNLIDQLTSIMGVLDEKVTGYVDSSEKMVSLSKDVARIILADIYMYQGQYAQAKSLLEVIANSNRYTLVEATDILDPSCSEVIWSQHVNVPTRARSFKDFIVTYNDNLCIIQTLGDVLLSLAECESKLGNDTKAREYINHVATIKGIETTSSESLTAISEIRSRIQIDFGGYFAFLKRTDLAQSVLGLEEYQLLFPIPQQEINKNPAMTQNPGYGGIIR